MLTQQRWHFIQSRVLVALYVRFNPRHFLLQSWLTHGTNLQPAELLMKQFFLKSRLFDCPAPVCEGNTLKEEEEDRTVHCASCWLLAGIRCWKLRTVWDPAWPPPCACACCCWLRATWISKKKLYKNKQGLTENNTKVYLVLVHTYELI